MRVLFLGKKRTFHYLFVVFCAILCLMFFSELPALPAKPDAIKGLQQQKQQIDQQRQSIKKERDRLTNLQKVVKEQLNGLQQNLKATNSQIQNSQLQLKQATEYLQQLEAKLATAEVSYYEQQAATIARLRFLQRSPTNQGWAVLLQSQNVGDFISRRRSLKLIFQADQKILVKLAAQAKQINKQRTEVEQQKNQIALIQQQLLAQQANTQAQAGLQQELMQRLNSDRLALEAAQTQLEKDSQAIAALIQQKIAAAAAKTNSRKNFIQGTGIFAYPSNAPTSSPFGWRIHPILGYRRFHAGLDFAASYGSTIRAADSGTVIFAGWYGGYGRAVIINHGNGITTLYGHCSELYVTEGQSVQRGQAIAAVGSTGLSTGPHLHFEVRKHGTPVDPMAYL
ncbi:MAG: peptidoglycan DD-metalloendopeptidase family protein [Chlorogloeopsis fritschii C42_A2020_084]|uniref:murein hydrolase activator EnvC family protein n=1 Tax=Chlorogloeopsis fritschii TaxID=1124 RepID=UPI001A104BE4|nr:M23 family metallopeptidase [Chlorogloeopsis fritschii]MBF2006426.1 peptidoglycan DD-metalloendopeptidase family protein [Chlorogloeopsis fritschii C42_A2020_084]